MAVTKETLRRMNEEFGGLKLSDAELDRVLPYVQAYTETATKLKRLDLSMVLPGRLLKLEEEGKRHAR